MALSRACANQAECASETFQHSERDVRGDRLIQDETKRKPVLRYIGDASMDRVRICVQCDAAAVKRDGAPIGRVHAEQRQCEFGSARTEQTGEAHDFSGAQLQAHIVIVTIAAKALDFEDNRTGGKVSAPVC